MNQKSSECSANAVSTVAAFCATLLIRVSKAQKYTGAAAETANYRPASGRLLQTGHSDPQVTLISAIFDVVRRVEARRIKM